MEIIQTEARRAFVTTADKLTDPEHWEGAAEAWADALADGEAVITLIVPATVVDGIPSDVERVGVRLDW